MLGYKFRFSYIPKNYSEYVVINDRALGIRIKDKNVWRGKMDFIAYTGKIPMYLL